MRDVLEALSKPHPDHLGLAHDVWSPLVRAGRGGERDDREEARVDAWFGALCSARVPRGYDIALERWRRSLRGDGDRMFEAQTAGRLLVGHGNPAPSEVGISLHRTWGVPFIPGSALAGLLAHYAEIALGPGPAAGELDMDDSAPERAQRAHWAGPARNANGDAVSPPGSAYRIVFGAPPIPGIEGSASVGGLIVHDALWLPGGRKSEDTAQGPLVRDVLTVHQARYYQDRAPWPSDGDDPNPVGFVSVRPGARFLFSLSSDKLEIVDWAIDALTRVLSEWGVGGKTAAGYGRFERIVVQASAVLAELEQALEASKETMSEKERLTFLEQHWEPRLRTLPSSQYDDLGKIVRRYIKSRKRRAGRDALLARITGG